MTVVQNPRFEHANGEKRSITTLVVCANSAWNLLNFRGPLIAGLIKAGYRIVAAAAPDGSESRLLELGAEFHPLPVDPAGRNPFADVRLLAALSELLRRERPAALLTFTVKPNIFGGLAARFSRTPVVATVSGLGSAFLGGGAVARLVERLYRLSLARAKAVFFQNDDDRDLFVERKLVRPDQVRRVAGSGVDLDRFAVVSLPAAETPVFLFVGRLLRDKGLFELIEAARLLRKRGVAAEVRLVGPQAVENPSAVTTAEVARWTADGLVTYLGPADDVRPAIAAADCLILPSYREGLPRSLLEGAAMGRPLIATDVSGCRDVVDHGFNGYLSAARSAPALAAAMADMCALSPTERRVMGERSRAKVEQEFSVQRVIGTYLAEISR